MSTSNEDFMVQCPYYREEGSQMVRCEGLSKGNSLQLSFNSKRGRNVHKEHYCRKSWTTCPIAKMLNEKYGYEPI